MEIHSMLEDGLVDLPGEAFLENFVCGILEEGQSPNALRIIRNTMGQSRVKMFRPEWTKGMGSGDNEHLCRVATVIFIKLVRSGKYSGISAEALQPKKIFSLIVNHLNETWRRK